MEVRTNAYSLVYSIIPAVILASLYHINGSKTNQTHSQPQQKTTVSLVLQATQSLNLSAPVKTYLCSLHKSMVAHMYLTFVTIFIDVRFWFDGLGFSSEL